MARGKHSRAKARRDGAELALAIEEAEAELAREKTLLEESRGRMEYIKELRGRLATATAQRDAAVATVAEQLAEQAAALTKAAELAEQHHQKVQHAWSRYTINLVNRIGGGYEGQEFLWRLLSGQDTVVRDDTLRHMNLGHIQQLQRARGQRTLLREVKSATGKFPPRRAWRMALAAANGKKDPDSSHRQGEAERALARTAAATVAATDIDALDAWHPLQISVLDFDDDPRPILWERLGAVGSAAPLLADRTADHAAVDPTEPAPALEAAVRERIAARGAEHCAVLWTDSLGRSADRTRSSRIAAPWAAAPPFPLPRDAATLRHWYTLAAHGAWSRYCDYVDDDHPEAAEARDAFGIVSVGLHAAAAFWLPAGQTHGYADSEPLRPDDLEDLRLPYPQVLLTLADPLHLAPTATPTPDEQTILNELDHLIDVLHHDPATTLGDLEGRIDPLGLWNHWPTAGRLLELRGAHIEALLLLADSLGRPCDTFAWCLAIPTRAGRCLLRLTVPASRAATSWSAIIDNLAAVCAWADWHQPDYHPSQHGASSAAPPPGHGRATPGGDNVHVLNITRTERTTRIATSSDPARTLAPHVRRGHWRRHRHGPGLSLVKRIRVAPVLVNATRTAPTALAPRVYRLPDSR